MKKTLAIILVIAMIVCMLPAFAATAADDVVLGLNAKFYHAADHEVIRNVLPSGVTAEGAEATDHNDCQANMEGNHHYDSSIDAVMGVMTQVGEGVVPNYESDSFGIGYGKGMKNEDFLIDYTGYVTATVGGAYEFGTRKVDNCLFVEIKINGEWVTVYEFWAKNVWNDNGETYSGVTVNLEEGKSYEIHATVMEINGGEAIESRVKIDGEVKTLRDSGLVFTTTEPAAPIGPTNITYFETGAEWYYMTSGDYNDLYADDGWQTNAEIYSEWETANADLAGVWATDDASSMNSTIWAVKEFTVEDIDAIDGWALMTSMHFDDNMHFYVNGVEVFVHGTWNDGYVTYKLVKNATSVLKEGKNVVAVTLTQGWGGFGFDCSLYATCENTSAYVPTYAAPIEIDSADELIEFASEVNMNPEATKNQVANITGDIDMTGKEWTPIRAYYGTIKGMGYTISNLTYSPTVDATTNGSNDGVNVGLFITSLANNANVKGHVYDLNFDNCTLDIKGTDGDATKNYIIAGIVAGMVDRGYVSGCTVSNSTIKGATAAGAVAGVACWAYDTAGVYVQNCVSEYNTINARLVAGGILGYARGGDAVVINNATLASNTLTAETTGLVYGDVWYGDETVIMEKPAERKDFTLEDGKDFQFFYQTRANGDLTDYRVLIVADREWLAENFKQGFKISFTDGTTTKSFTEAPTAAYNNVYVELAETLEMYGTKGDDLIFGWVVTEVPAGFTPSATIGDLTVE